MKSILAVVICFLSFGLYGQGSVTINQSSSISQMMDSFIANNRAEETIKGWRIQIITTDDRRKMENARSKFRSMYPNVKESWTHVAPYYRVKIGAYENKLQLMGFLLELKEDFPGVIPIRDDIKKMELVGY